MKIAVFGATGGTGKNIVEQALAAGHDVVAVARRPEAITTKHARLTVAKADVSDAAAVGAALAGVDAAISAIGPASNTKPGTVISDATRNILAGCAQHGVNRFVLESGIMMSDGSELSWFARVGVKLFSSLLPKLKADKKIAEDAVRASALEWVIVRPPALNHSAKKGGYVLAERASITPTKAMAHADVAEGLLRAATSPDLVRKVANIGYA
jgi:putative NADH-flavin reductase